jgi:hypothetical protein
MRFVLEVSPVTDDDGSTTLFLFSHEDWTTKPTDTPPNTPVRGLIESAGSLRRELFSQAHVTGAISSQFGIVSLRSQFRNEDDEGQLDDWMDYGFAGCDVVLRWGPRDGAYPADYHTIYVAKGLSLPADSEGVTLKLRDELEKLNTPVVTEPFTLTGGLEGPIDGGSIGKRKQFVSADPGFVTPILIDRNRQIYFLQSTSDGGLRDLFLINTGEEVNPFDVFDNGVEISRTSTHYSTEAELLATAPTAGTVKYYFGPDSTARTGWKTGPVYFRLGSPPSGELRVYAVGYPTDEDHDRRGSVVGSFFASTFALRAGIPKDNVVLDAQDLYVGPHFVDDDTTYLSILEDAALSLQGFFGFNRRGKFRSGYLLDPEDDSGSYGVDPSLFGTPPPPQPTTSLYTFNKHNSKDIKREAVAGMEAPMWSAFFQFGKSRPISNFAGAATALIRDYMSREFWAESSGVSETTRRANPGAVHVNFKGSGRYFQNSFGMRFALERSFVLYGGRRHFWTWTVNIDDNFDPAILELDLHDVVTLQYHRLQLSAGKKVRIVAITLDISSDKPKIVFTGWGGEPGRYTGSGSGGGGGDDPPIGPSGVPLGETALGLIDLEAYIPIPGLDILLDKPLSNLTLSSRVLYGADPYFADVVLLMHCDQDSPWIDSSSYAATLTASGTISASTSSPLTGVASMTPGASGYVGTPIHARYNMGSGDVTVEFTLRLNSTPSFERPLFIGGNGIEPWFQSSTTALSVIAFGSVVCTSSALSLSTTYHIAIVKQGTTYTIYADGVSIGSGTKSGSDDGTTTRQMTVGSSTGSQPLTSGKIDNIRITKGVARYTSSFTPPSVPYPEF